MAASLYPWRARLVPVLRAIQRLTRSPRETAIGHTPRPPRTASSTLVEATVEPVALSCEERRVLEAMRAGDGVALVMHAASGAPRVQLGTQAGATRVRADFDRTVAVLQTLLRHGLVERAGGSQCSEVFRVTGAADGALARESPAEPTSEQTRAGM